VFTGVLVWTREGPLVGLLFILLAFGMLAHGLSGLYLYEAGYIRGRAAMLADVMRMEQAGANAAVLEIVPQRTPRPWDPFPGYPGVQRMENL
jgi:hypothetical protein